MQVIGLCRFSWPGEGGFQVEHPDLDARIAYLYSDARMEARLRQFEAIALPGLRAQTDPDFTLLVIIGETLPEKWRDRLLALLEGFPQARVMPMPPGPHRRVMQDAINDARRDPDAACLQFRHDDDDAVAIDFVERLRRAARDCAGLLEGNRLVGFDFNRGLVARAGPQGLALAETVMPLYGVALGLAARGSVRQTIMNFAHKKLNRFMPVVSFGDSAMFIRGLGQDNDSRQRPGIPEPKLTRPDPATAQLLRDRFRIDEGNVRRVFAAR